MQNFSDCQKLSPFLKYSCSVFRTVLFFYCKNIVCNVTHFICMESARVGSRVGRLWVGSDPGPKKVTRVHLWSGLRCISNICGGCSVWSKSSSILRWANRVSTQQAWSIILHAISTKFSPFWLLPGQNLIYREPNSDSRHSKFIAQITGKQYFQVRETLLLNCDE